MRLVLHLEGNWFTDTLLKPSLRQSLENWEFYLVTVIILVKQRQAKALAGKDGNPGLIIQRSK